MNIIDKLKEYPVNSNIALLIRHSERDKIPDGEFGNDVMLNENGINNSIKFGEDLKQYKVNAIYSSPIKRCVQTASNVIIGYGENIEIIESNDLGDPGMHVLDADIVGQYYLKNGFWEMFNNFKNGESIQGLPKKEELKEFFYNFISSKTIESGITIFITHDSLIAFVAFVIGIKEYTEINWVDYLDGIILKVEKYGEKL